MDCRTLDELNKRFEREGHARGDAANSTVERARSAAEALVAARQPVLAAELLTGATLVALVVSDARGAEVVEMLARSASELMDAEAVRIGLLALGDPLLLSAALDDALRTHVTLIAGLTGCRAVTVWKQATGGLPVPLAHAGDLPVETTRRSVVRALRDEGENEHVVVVRALGEPCATLAWLPADGRHEVADALAGRSADLLTSAFECARLLDAETPGRADELGSAERRLSRVGFDLHDGPLQEIALLRGQLSALHGSLAATPTPAVRDSLENADDVLMKVEDLMAIAEATETDLRELARSMESDRLMKRPLDESLRGIARSFALRTGIEPQLELNGDLAGLTRMERCTLIRVVGEAMANAREHSTAASVAVSVSVSSGHVAAFVRDDGSGFDVDSKLRAGEQRGSLGLIGMIERVRLLGGVCRVKSRPGSGTTVAVSFDRYFASAAGADAALPAAA